jgi:hypothetical protein
MRGRTASSAISRSSGGYTAVREKAAAAAARFAAGRRAAARPSFARAASAKMVDQMRLTP